MSNRIKNLIGVAAIIVGLAMAAAYAFYVKSYSQSISPSGYRSFAVTGEGKAVAVPDVAQFTFSVITEGGTKIADLQKENTEKVNKIVDFLKAMGIDAKDIKTLSYNLDPRYQHYSCLPGLLPYGSGEEAGATPCRPSEIAGYTITQQGLVKVRDFEKIGEVLGGVTDNGANSVSALSFTIDDRTAVERNARQEAIAKAKAKAEELAKAGGFRLGRLLQIDEGSSPQPYYSDQYGYGGAEALKAAPAIPTIEPGSQDVTINVTLRYEIK